MQRRLRPHHDGSSEVLLDEEQEGHDDLEYDESCHHLFEDLPPELQ